MAEFDWMDSEAFKEEIESQIKKAAGGEGMKQYRTAIVGWIADQIKNNKKDLELIENRKASFERRTKVDGLRSIDSLVRGASARARRADREIVTLEDVQAEFKVKLCRVWPICK